MEKSSQAGWDCRTKEQHRGRLIRFFFRLLCPTVGAGEAGNPEITMTQTALQKPCFLCLEHEGRGSLARRNTFRWQLPYSSQAPWKKQGPHPTPVTKIWEGPRCSQVVTRHTPPPRGLVASETAMASQQHESLSRSAVSVGVRKHQGGVCVSEHLVGTLSS